jgi:O-antigen/teichoic acid export membrane protein
LFIYLQNILIGTGSIKQFVKTNVMLSVSPLFFLSFFLFDKKLTSSEAIYAYMLSYLASCLYSIWCCMKATGGTFQFKPCKALALESLRYGVKINIGSIIQIFRDNLETLFIGYFMSTAAIGYYSIAQGLSERLKLLPKSISYILFAEISGSEHESQYRLVSMVTRNTLWLMTLVIIPLIALGKFIVSFLYGNEFLPALIPLYVLFFSTILSSISLTLGSLALGKGEPQICTYVTAIGFISTIGLDIWLIPVWGLPGAAIANTSGLAVMVCLYFLVFKKHTDIRLTQFLLIQKEDFNHYLLIMGKVKCKLQRLIAGFQTP